MDQSHLLVIILCSSIVLNFVMILSWMIFIRKVKRDQRRRQQQIVEQAKINSTLQDSLDIANQTIKNYQQMLDR